MAASITQRAGSLEAQAERLLERAGRLRGFEEPKRGTRYELDVWFEGGSTRYRYLALRVKGVWFVTGRANESYAPWAELFNGWANVERIRLTRLVKASS